ncbi:DUF695 domain-containing protein [soil metagenome]
MTKHFTILLVFFLCGYISFSQDDNWDVYMAQYEKGVGSTVINMSLKVKAPMKKFPFLLSTGVKLNKCSTDGLPVKEEFENLYKISDRIKFIIDSISKNYACGTFSYQCERKDYYYITDTIGIRKIIEFAYQVEFPDYKYLINIKNDANWEAYLTFLYPNEETFEYMTNDKVIRNLTKEGDDLSQPRQVDHWAYFKTEEERDQFSSFALKEKFKIENKTTVDNSILKYGLQFSRIDNVQINNISKITINLRQEAKRLNGQYDGWETFVIRGK